MHIDELIKYKSVIEINNFDELEYIVTEVSKGYIFNIKFKNSTIKNRFFSLIEINRPDITIINVNTDLDTFNKHIYNTKNIIYNNICRCDNTDILNYILSDNKTIIC